MSTTTQKEGIQEMGISVVKMPSALFDSAREKRPELSAASNVAIARIGVFLLMGYEINEAINLARGGSGNPGVSEKINFTVSHEKVA